MRTKRVPLRALPVEAAILLGANASLDDVGTDRAAWLVRHDRDAWHVIAAEAAARLAAAGVGADDWPWLAAAAADADTPWFAASRRPELGAGLVLLDADGAVAGFCPAALLLTQLHEAYERLQAQHETTLAAANDALCIIDENHQVLGFNGAAERLFGIAASSILGRKLDDHFEPDRLWGPRVIRTGEHVRQLAHEPQPGTHAIINALPIIVNDRIIGAVTSEQDVTQFVRLQAVLRETSSRMTYLESEMGRLQQVDDPFRHIAGIGPAREQLVAWVRKVAPTDATVLIRGESGVGKELVARAIHDVSRRAAQPFEVVNCGAIPPALFESELFGYEGGAFTGAGKRGKPGRLELAHGGTLFLDEVGDLPLEMQVKLLRVLESRQLYRLGGTVPRDIDVRFVAATNRDLEAMVSAGTFRDDLFYRLRVVTLHVPPLRERMEDVPELINLFLQEFSVRYRRPVREIEPTVMQALLQYHWPGNVRELRNVIEQLIALADDGMIRAAYLPRELGAGVPVGQPDAAPLQQAAQRAEKEAVAAALLATGGNRSAAAKRLGISRPTLYAKMRQFGLR